MSTISMTEARSKLYSIANEVNETNTPITLTNNRNSKKNCVLIAESDWNAICETLYLNSIPGYVENILKMASENKETLIDEKDIKW